MLQGSDAALGPLAAVVQTTPGHTLTVDTSQTPVRIDGDTLTVTGTSAASWPIQGLGQATLKLASATLTVTAADATTASIAATLPLSPSQAPAVTIAPGTTAGTWAVSLAGAASGVTATELIMLGLGGSLPFDVPPSLDVFSQLTTVNPGTFTIRFAPNTTGSAYYTFGVSVAGASWHLIPQVIDFTGLDVVAVITTGAWSVTVIGHLTVSGVAMALAMQIGSSSVWTASLLPDGQAAFPGIVELANWFSGRGALGQQTSAGFSGLQLNPNQFDLALAGVVLTFDVDAGQVVSLQITGRLTVVGLPLTLVLLLPAITLQGSLAQPGITVVQMLTAASISTAGVPTTLAIAAVNFRADADTSTYAADVEVDGIWPSPPLKLEQITAAVSYAAGTLTGSFGAQIAIAGVTLALSAEYAAPPAGWTFSGRTLPGSTASIGALINDLSTEFGIGTVPAALASLTLTELHVAYTTGTGAFDFGCTATLNVDGTPVTLVATIAVTKTGTTTGARDQPDASVVVGDRGYSAKFGGQITFSGLEFDLIFDLTDDNADIFVADYIHTGQPAPVELKSLVAALSATLAEAVPAGVSIDLQEVKFLFYKKAATMWAFGLRLGTTIDLSQLPVVGSHLPPELGLGLDDLQALYANQAFTADQTTLINQVLPSGVTKLPDTLAAGITLDGVLRLGTEQVRIGTGVKPASQSALRQAQGAEGAAQGAEGAAQGAEGAAVATTASTQPITWVEVNQQFGVFTFRRVGIGYADNVLLFSLDASVALGPLAFSMEALTVGSPLNRFAPTFSLGGLSLVFDRPPISLGGAFLRVDQTRQGRTFTAYYGEVLVTVPQFSLTAIGGWAPDADPASFFIYLSITAPIGGPPFLQVTGLAGGFGINSRLILPTIDDVGGYPLLPSQHPPAQPTNPADSLSTVLPALQKTFEVLAGEYWVAAGLAATSFEMINVQAVLSVGFGVEVQIGVVGTASMTFPTGDPSPVAYIEIDVVASYTPATGLLAIAGKLSPASYLYGGFVKLSGGFALSAWFSGPSSGDFVVSIGGYHPAFDKPPDYPVVPRLALSFSLGPIKVLGQAYFALTPGAFMAGISLQATFSAGPIDAWFSAGLDFLIAWAPFHYQAHAWVAIGCKVDLGLFTLTIQIGADLQVWGPPFGGQAVVDLDVVSFTVAFGAAAKPPAPVGWSTMVANFLQGPATKSAPVAAASGPFINDAVLAVDPAPVKQIVSASVTAGRLPANAPGMDWLIDGNRFRIAVTTNVPANHPQCVTGATTEAELPNLVDDYTREPTARPTGDDHAETAAAAPGPLPTDLRLALDADTITFSATQVWQPVLDLGPMAQTGVKSYLSVALCLRAEQGDTYPTFVTALTVLPTVGNATAALFGDGQASSEVNGNRLIPYALLGLDLAPLPRHPDSVNDIALLELIFAEGIETGFAYSAPAPPSPYTVHGSLDADHSTLTITVDGPHTVTLPNTGYVLDALTDPWISQQRSALADALRLLGFDTPPGPALQVTGLAQTALSDWPGVALIGQPS